MSVMICQGCGEQVTLQSRLQEECPECGSEDLVELDAYDPEPEVLICVDCGYRVSGGRRAGSDDDSGSGRFTVDDPCPRCEGVLDPDAGRSRPRHEQPEYTLARSVAAKLMRKYGQEAPVDVAMIARREGLEVVRVPEDADHDGRLVDGRIEIPADLGSPAGRFGIGHELGHHCLRHQVPEARIEREANAFAAELLISAGELKAVVAKRPTLNQLCGTFGASRQAMVYALMRHRMIESVAPTS